MRTLTLLILTLTFLTGRCTTYWMANAGSDAAAGTSLPTAWATLPKLNSMPLAPGDIVNFNPGDVFYGNIVPRTGVVFNGVGAKSTISGYAAVTGWTVFSGNVYQANYTVGTSPVTQLAIGGVQQKLGRYPNTGYITIVSHTNNSVTNASYAGPTITSPQAQVAVRSQRWVLDRNTFLSKVGGTFNFSQASQYTPVVNHGFFLQNDKALLDQQGEWAYESPATPGAVGTVYVYSTTPPANVEISSVDFLMETFSPHTMTFRNLRFTGANQYAFGILNSHDVTIDSCEIINIGSDAMYLQGSPNTKITNTLFNHVQNDCIKVDNSINTLITDNVLKNIGAVPGMGRSGDGCYWGILASGSGTKVLRNRIDSVGYNGISFGGANVDISYNHVNYYCFNLDDGGAYYGYGPESIGNKLTYNTATNGVGAPIGVGATEGMAHAFYADDEVNFLEISNNNARDISGVGIFLHNTHDITVRNNNIFNAGIQGIHVFKDFIRPTNIRNLVIKNNIITALPGKRLANYESFNGDVELMASPTSNVDSNVYARPGDPAGGKIFSYDAPNGYYVPLPEWKGLFGFDPNSTGGPTGNGAIRFESNPTASPMPVALGGSYVDMKGTPQTGTIVLPPYSSITLLQTAAAPIPLTYYVSNSGTAGGPGTSVGAAWTPAYANTQMASMSPGSSVLYKRGEQFAPPTVAVDTITYDAYGTGAKPLINCFTTLTSWIDVGGGIYEAALESGTKLKTVSIDGIPRGMGRYPDYVESTGGFLIMTTAGGDGTTNVLTASGLTGSWVGATIVSKTMPYLFDITPILTQNGTTLTFANQPHNQRPSAGCGFFIQNHPATLTTFGEWYYNPTTKTLRVFFGAGGPTGHVVKASIYDKGFDLANRKGVRIINFQIQGADEGAINIKNSSNCTIQNNDISFTGTNGIDQSEDMQTGTSSHTYVINNNTFKYSGNSAIFGYLPFTLVTNNRADSSGMIDGLGMSGNAKHAGFDFNGWGPNMQYSTYENNSSNYSGLGGLIWTGSHMTVRNNKIYAFSMRLADAGGISTYRGDSQNYPVDNLVEGNTVDYGYGNNQGTITPTPYGAIGIYFDDESSGGNIKNNVVTRCSRAGVLIHNGHGMRITGNTITRNVVQVSFVDDAISDHTGVDYIHNIFFKYNTIICTDRTQSMLELASTPVNPGPNQFGQFDSNTYIRPVDAGQWMKVNDVPMDPANWRRTYSYDLNSTFSQIPVVEYAVTGSVPGTATTIPNHVTPNTYAPQFRYQNVTMGSNIVAGKTYKWRFRVVGNTDSVGIQAKIQQWGPTFDILYGYGSYYFTVRTVPTDYEITILATENSGAIKMTFDCLGATFPLTFSDMSWEEVIATKTNTDTAIVMVANPSTSPIEFDAGNSIYTDAAGKSYRGKVQIPAQSSKVFIKSPFTNGAIIRGEKKRIIFVKE